MGPWVCQRSLSPLGYKGGVPAPGLFTGCRCWGLGRLTPGWGVREGHQGQRWLLKALKHLVSMTRKSYVSKTQAEWLASLKWGIYFMSSFRVRCTHTLTSHSSAAGLLSVIRKMPHVTGAEMPLGWALGIWVFPAPAGQPSGRAGAKARKKGCAAQRRGLPTRSPSKPVKTAPPAVCSCEI